MMKIANFELTMENAIYVHLYSIQVNGLRCECIAQDKAVIGGGWGI
jgi:hypothetical protein